MPCSYFLRYCQTTSFPKSLHHIALCVGRGWKLSHYRGQIEPPASLPGGALVGYSGEVMFEER
jgi:hypothetical protein